MCQNQKTTLVKSAAAPAAGRELLDPALQRNPLIAVAAAVIVQILGLFRRRGARATTSIRKMKLESYSSSPVETAANRRVAALERTTITPRSHPDRRSGHVHAGTAASPPKRSRRRPRRPSQPRLVIEVQEGGRHDG